MELDQIDHDEAKARDKSAKDFTQIRQIKDEQGVVLWQHDKIIERWKGYYGNLLNEENPRTVLAMECQTKA